MHKIITLKISDESYSRLTQMARDAGFITGQMTARGLHKYVAKLVWHDMLDTRPRDIQEYDESLRTMGCTPEWVCYEPRTRHNMLVSQETLAQASVLCWRLGIATMPPTTLKGAPTVLDGVECLSLLLDGIGSEWITIEGQVHHD